VSTLMAGVPSAAGHPSGRQTAADTGMAIDTSLVTGAGYQPFGRRSFRKQRTVDPPIALARYNLLYSSSRPALRAAAYGGRPRPAAPRRVRGRTYRRSRTAAALPLKCTLVNSNSGTTYLANTQTPQ
jgi:hypothetical protein